MQRTTARISAIAAAVVVVGAMSALPAAADDGDLDIYLANPLDRRDSVSALDIGNVLDGDVPLLCDIADDAEGDSVTLFRNGAWRIADGDGEVSFGRAGDVPLCGNFGVVTDDDDEPAQDTFAVRRGNRYFLSQEPAVLTSGSAARSFVFGRATDQALVGDWDGDGIDTIAVRRGNTVFFATSNVDGGGGVRTSSYGRASEVAVAGDFAGGGFDSIAVRRGSTFLASDGRAGERLSTAVTFQYGRTTDIPVAGSPFRDEDAFLGVVRIEG